LTSSTFPSTKINLLSINKNMNDYANYANALGLSNFAEQIAEGKAQVEEQKRAALLPLSELAVGVSSTEGLGSLGGALKNAVISKGKEILASKLKDAGIDDETIAKITKGDIKGTFDEIVGKAKDLMKGKADALKQHALDKAEELKQAALDKAEQIKQDVQDKVKKVVDNDDDGVEDGFPEGTDLFPSGSGGVVDLGGPDAPPTATPPSAAPTEAPTDTPTDTPDVPEVPPEAPGIPEGFSDLDGAFGDSAKVITGLGEKAVAAAGSLGETAAAAGTDVAAAVGETVLGVASEFLGPVGEIAGFIGGLVGLFKGTEAPTVNPNVLNASTQFGA
jgi:hypothetical protein